jgi:hypothetical protein
MILTIFTLTLTVKHMTDKMKTSRGEGMEIMHNLA